MRPLIIMIIVLTVSSCKREETISSYYPDGNLKETVIYQDKNIDTVYMTYSYSETGHLLRLRKQAGKYFKIYEYDNYGILKTEYETWDNNITSLKWEYSDSSAYRYSYRQGVLHGISYQYLNEDIVKELLYLNNKPLVYRQKYYSVDSLMQKTDIIRLTKEGQKLSGYYINSIHPYEIINELSNYYKLIINDTILQNDTVKANIEYIGDQNDFEMLLQIGDINADFQLDNVQVKQTDNNGNVSVNLPTSNIGINLIIGNLTISFPDTKETKDFIFFYEYLVQPKYIIENLDWENITKWFDQTSTIGNKGYSK